MKVDGTHYRSVWVDADGWSVRIFDQTKLPWALDMLRLTDAGAVAHAIRTMQVRGAPLIGAVAAYGLCLALRSDPSTTAMEREAAMLAATRPTAINLRWAIDRMLTRAGLNTSGQVILTDGRTGETFDEGLRQARLAVVSRDSKHQVNGTADSDVRFDTHELGSHGFGTRRLALPDA